MSSRPPFAAPQSQRAYSRERDLARLIALWPSEIADRTADGQHRLVGKLRRALREERQRGIAGHWAYDVARHAALLHAYRQELEMSRRAEQKGVLRGCDPSPISRGACQAPFSSQAESALRRT